MLQINGKEITQNFDVKDAKEQSLLNDCAGKQCSVIEKKKLKQEYNRCYYIRNNDIIKERRKLHYLNKIDKMRHIAKQYYQKSKSKMLQSSIDDQKAIREKRNMYKKIYNSKNKDKKQASNKRYCLKRKQHLQQQLNKDQ